MKRCHYQGKKKFHTKADALFYAAKRGFSYERHRAYECPHCGFWHLTTTKTFRGQHGLFARVRSSKGEEAA